MSATIIKMNNDDESLHAAAIMDLNDEDEDGDDFRECPFDPTVERVKPTSIAYTDIRKRTVVELLEPTESFVSESKQNELANKNITDIIKLLDMLYGKALVLKGLHTHLGGEVSSSVIDSALLMRDKLEFVFKNNMEKAFLNKTKLITER